MRGFSFASVVLSYFMVAGGMFAGVLTAGYAHVESEYMLFLIVAVGAAAGGYFAARGSRGSTIIEPAIGGLAVVATLVGLVAGSAAGKQLFATADNEVTKAVALLAASGTIGALAGAWVAEKFFGDAPTSTLPWVVYSALTTFGATVMVSYIAAATSHDADSVAKMMLLGFVAGCLLGGIAIGASSRARPLLASLVGGAAGVAGLGLLVAMLVPTSVDKDAKAGIAVLAVAGGVITLIGALIGWAAVGKKAEGAVTG